MESSIESFVNLLESWRRAETRVHLSFSNKWEGWNFDGAVTLDAVELKDGILLLVASGWAVSFSVEKFRRVSILNPLEAPEGISFPESSSVEEVAYVSDKAVLITLGEKDSETPYHSSLAISKILDGNFPEA
jgi:hypothetical protein